MNRRNFLQTAGIALFASPAIGSTQTDPNGNTVAWKDIKKEQPTDDTKTYLVFADCYNCPSSDICNLKNRGAHYVFRTKWFGGSAKQFAFCLQPQRITHWIYFNTPEINQHYKEFIKNNPYIVA